MIVGREAMIHAKAIKHQCRTGESCLARTKPCVFGMITGALVVLIAGCAEEPPSPVLVDPTGFVTYAHPTGVFSLSMPPDWVVNDLSDEAALAVEFSPPDSPEPQLRVYIVSVAGENAQAADAVELLSEQYLALRYGGASDTIYKDMGHEAQPDGSVRVGILADTPLGPVQYNDFLQAAGPYFGSLQVRLPAEDLAHLRTLERIVNTFALHPEAAWRSVGQNTETSDVVGFDNLNAWVGRNGSFQIMGQVVNNGTVAIEFIHVTAQLYDADNRVLAERDDFVSSDLLLPGERAPFSLLFPDGLPTTTVRYELHAAARYAGVIAQTFYGSENFAMASEAILDENDWLVVQGQVRNDGTSRADLVRVIVTVFDDQQRVIGTDATLVDAQSLGPGEVSDFSVTFGELGGVAHTFLAAAQARVAE
jgi:hypothetical protein